MAGATLSEFRIDGTVPDAVQGDYIAVTEAGLPFRRFPKADAVLGPEMRSTGEVMGIDLSFGLAFAKSQLAAGDRMPTSGTVFMSLADRDKPTGLRAAKHFAELGFEIAATTGTAEFFKKEGCSVSLVVAKVGSEEGEEAEDGLDAVELLEAGRIDLVVNSPRGRGPRADGGYIRAAAGLHNVPLLTTASAALAAANGIAETLAHEPVVRSLQEYHAGVRRP